MSETKYIFRKTHDVDKEVFADLLQKAKGGRTMKDFADLCGVNPSTFTRIVQKANKGASSPQLLEAIVANAVPESGVTIELLAKANGYTVEPDTGVKGARLSSYFDSSTELIRTVLIQSLLDRGADVRLGRIKYGFTKSLCLSPDALIMTNAFGNENDVWFVDSALAVPRIAREDGHPIHKTRVKQIAFDKISRFVFISMSKCELFRPIRYTLVVFDSEMYDIMVEEFEETLVPTDISIMLIDPLNSTILKEYMLPHTEKGPQTSYFISTPTLEDNNEYLTSDSYDDNE